MPADTRSPAAFGIVPDVYVPITKTLVPSLDRADTGHVQMVGRLRAGQGVEGGRAALAVVTTRAGAGLGVERDATIRSFSPVGGLDQSRDVREIALFFLVLQVLTVLVLTIACANVAGLLLARSTARGREIAVRLTLGATRRRLLQQLLTEGLVLATLGVGAGLAFTAAVGALVARVSLPLPMPIEFHVDFTGRLFLIAAGLVIVSALMCGLTPALYATRASLSPALKQAAPSYGHRRFTLRNLIVTGQVAIAVLLLVVTLLFTRNLALAHTLAPGFNVDRTLVADVTFVEGRQGPRAAPVAAAIADRLRAVAGVTSVAFAEGVPLTFRGSNSTGTRIRIEGHDAPVRVEYASNYVSHGYFQTMGIALRRGRDFTPADRPGTPPVVIVNEEFARRYLPDPHALGRHLHLPTGRDETTVVEIVGVVANSKYPDDRRGGQSRDLRALPATSRHGAPRHTDRVRRGGRCHRRGGDSRRRAADRRVRRRRRRADVIRLGRGVCAEPRRRDAARCARRARRGAGRRRSLRRRGVQRRSPNRGGRGPHRARRLATRRASPRAHRTVWLAGVGIAAGLGLSFVATPLLSSFLVAGLSANDPVSFVGTAVLVTLTSLLAAWRPAFRAVRVQPSVALRAE